MNRPEQVSTPTTLNASHLLNELDSPAPLRVAHLLDGRHFGGAEQIVRRLIQAAPATGVQAWGYCLSEGRLAEFLRGEGLPVRVIGARGKYDWRMLPRLARAAREDGIQLLQAHTSRTHLLARLLSLRLGIPNVTTIHSPIAQDENRSVGAHPLRAMVERLGRPLTQHIVAVGREEAERLAREEGLTPARLTWIPNGVEPPPPSAAAQARAELAPWLAERDLPPDCFVAAMIAQMRPRKGPEVAIRAFARWVQGGGHGALLMIGDDEFTRPAEAAPGEGYLDSLRRLAREAGVERLVQFTGFMAEPWRLAGAANLILLPSLFGEGLPLVLLEAMSHGLPLAVSDTPGNRELAAGGRHGWLHPAGDDAALARQLAEAAGHPAEARGRGQAAREHFLGHYTLQAVASRYGTLYRQLIP